MTFRQILTAIRWMIGVALIGMLIWNPMAMSLLIGKLFPKIEWGNSDYATVTHIFIAVATVIAAVICLREPLIAWVSYPIRNFFSNIFYPDEKVVPPPNYNVATLYRDQDRLDEAVEVYLGILHHHPQEVLAYVEGIKTAFDASQPETAAKIAGLAGRLTEETLRGHIAAIYEEARQEYALRPMETELEAGAEEAAEEAAENSGEETPGR